MTDKTQTPKEHYTDDRKWSYVSNAWIYESQWNNQEEIAMLRHSLAAAKEPRK